MPDFTLRIVSEKEAATAEDAVRELAQQIHVGEIMIEVFYGDNYEHKDVPDQQFYLNDLEISAELESVI
jgi:hypothetical protein